MQSSWILRLVSLVRTDVSEESITSIIRVTRFGELGTNLAVASYCFVPSAQILSTLMMEAIICSETSVLKRAKRPNIREDSILCTFTVQTFCECIETYKIDIP
jgi:hypothetical protein